MLLAEYEETVGTPVKLPIPVADITSYHLALQLGFADLHKTLGIPMLRDQPDILGESLTLWFVLGFAARIAESVSICWPRVSAPCAKANNKANKFAGCQRTLADDLGHS
jgi:hypothetical protein